MSYCFVYEMMALAAKDPASLYTPYMRAELPAYVFAGPNVQ